MNQRQSHLVSERNGVRPPRASSRRGLAWLTGALTLLVLTAQPLLGQMSLGLFRDGQCLQSFSLPVSTNTSMPTNRTRHAALAAPPVSATAEARAELLAQAVQPVLDIGTLLEASRSASAMSLVAVPVDSAKLRPRLDDFLRAQEPARQALLAVGERVLELNLPSENFDRHLTTLAAFDRGVQEFTNAIQAVLEGGNGAVDQALALIDQFKLHSEPDLSRRGPTRRWQTALTAPVLSRE